MTHVRRAVACIAATTAALFAFASVAAAIGATDVDDQCQRRGLVDRARSSSPTVGSRSAGFPGFETP